jgi:Xaa-Pro aminopeptidase
MTAMRGAYLDRRRAEAAMRAAGIDALVVVQPENFQYATGATPGVAALFRRAGAAVAIIPVAAEAKAAAIVSDLFEPAFRRSSDIEDARSHRIWVETADVSTLLPSNRPIQELIRASVPPASGRRPATFDPHAAFALVREALAERGLLRARLGIEFDFLPVSDLRLIESILPEATLVDSSDVFRRLRVVKSAREIALLRTGAELAETGIRAVQAGLHEGQTRPEISELWRRTVVAEAQRRGITNMTGDWDYTSVGPDPWGPGDPVARGSVIKIDVGCVLAGYSSDSARTFAFGRASEHARAIYAGLLDAFRAGREAFKPGNTLGDVHRAASAAMHRAGFAGFDRGHFGHGIGQNVFSEEWPFTAHGADLVLEPGMVLAFETPYYVNGVGGFIIEDQLLVTASGHETMNTLPYEFLELG